MAEVYPADADLTALSGTTDATTGTPYPTQNVDPWFVARTKADWQLARVAELANELRVYKDGDLTFGVRPGRYHNGHAGAGAAYAGAAAQALTDDDTNYIYLTTAGALTVNLTGFPVTPHFPLATIAVGSESVAAVSSEYNHVDIVDYRGGFRNAPAPGISITAAAEDGADERVVSIQMAAGRHLVRIWIAATEYAVPDATGNTVAVDTGTAYETKTAHADYNIITSAAGLAQLGITVAGAATSYVHAEIEGRIYSSGALTWAA